MGQLLLKGASADQAQDEDDYLQKPVCAQLQPGHNSCRGKKEEKASWKRCKEKESWGGSWGNNDIKKSIENLVQYLKDDIKETSCEDESENLTEEKTEAQDENDGANNENDELETVDDTGENDVIDDPEKTSVVPDKNVD